jgi:murein DD-endopeptidase MepM/ murein hydrolase activator NlpD
MTWSISASVGRWERGASNYPADVRTVQTLLASVATRLADPRLDPGPISGTIERPSSQSRTVIAIEVFQSRYMNRPDGLIDVNGRTWKELVREDAGTTTSPNPSTGGSLYFPFPVLPATNWIQGARAFGVNRNNGTRAHAGCDLYFPQSTWIHAIADGIVVRGPTGFFAQTYALEVDHGDFLARYCEVQANSLVRSGDRVRAGQKIARVGRLVGVSVPSDMLHLELYDKSASGPLTVEGSGSKRRADGVPFNRRRDLIDPTPYLNQWSARLPQAY